MEKESFGSITMSFSNVSRVTVLGLRFPAAGTTRILQMEIRPLPSQTFSKPGPRKENYCKFIFIYNSLVKLVNIFSPVLFLLRKEVDLLDHLTPLVIIRLPINTSLVIPVFELYSHSNIVFNISPY